MIHNLQVNLFYSYGFSSIFYTADAYQPCFSIQI